LVDGPGTTPFNAVQKRNMSSKLHFSRTPAGHRVALGFLVILMLAQPLPAAVRQMWVPGNRMGGKTNQWTLFAYTNVSMANFRNVAIVTVSPPELSRVDERREIDLYVARSRSAPEKNSFILDPAAVFASQKSVGRAGMKFVAFSNAQPQESFFIGVKSEERQPGTFGIMIISSDEPFSRRDANNNVVATAFPLPAEIPDGAPNQPRLTNLFALVLEPEVTVQRIYVTNSIIHEEGGDLVGILSHADPKGGGTDTVTLNNRRAWNGINTTVYDDSDQGDLGDATSIPPVVRSDGPGSLRDFVGHGADGVWQYAISDNALSHTGRVEQLSLVIQPANTNNDFPIDLSRPIGPGRWLHAAFDASADATNVQICVQSDGPVDLYERRSDFPTSAFFFKALTNIPPPGACMEVGLNDNPPLYSGRYYVGVHNPGTGSVRVRLVVTMQRSFNPTLNVRGARENALAELIGLRAAVTNRSDGRKLDAAIKHLDKSLTPRFWLDDTHLNRKHGARVFHEGKLVAARICSLVESPVSLPFFPRRFPAEGDRLLAVVAIEEAIMAGASTNKIEEAQRFLAQGDAEATDNKCSKGIEDYRQAWKHASR
jgi:hypothetical protein